MRSARLHPVAVPRTAAPPLIGVVTHELLAECAPGWAMAPGRSGRDLAPQRLSMRLSYTQAVQEAGGIAVVLPTHGYVDDTGALLDRLDGLLVSGGPDLDPAVYGQARHPALGPEVDRVSDEYELALLAGAAERDLPMLGICRGLQALNDSRGGTLHQHLPDRSELGHLQSHEPFAPAHAVDVARGSLLHWLTGCDGFAVNSFHHQAADRIGAGLEVCARAPDRTVEALWDPAASFCLGVQWHAELLTHRAEHAMLLRGLVDAACGLAPQLSLAA
jgi:putative glutamine amidotransferase